VAWVGASVPTGEWLGLIQQSSGPITSVWETDWTAPVGAPEGMQPVAFDAEDTATPPLAAHVDVPLVIDASPPPRPTINSPLDGAVIPVEAVLVTGKAEKHSHVTLYANGNPLATTPADAWGDWGVTLENLADGAYTLAAQARDSAGNPSELSLPVAVTVDTQPPVVSQAWADPLAVRTGSALATYARAQDAASGVAQVQATRLRPQGGAMSLGGGGGG